MGLDALSPTAPARVKVLVLPVGNTKQSRFNAFVRRLQRENVVRLGDVSPDNRPNRTMFSPLAFPDGLVHYEISPSCPPASHLNLVPFELYRLPLLVIGVADGSQSIAAHNTKHTTKGSTDHGLGQTEALGRSLETIKVDYPSALVHRILLFDSLEDFSDLSTDVIQIPPPPRSRTTTIKTIMCDMTSILLAEMTSYAKSLQALSTIDTPCADKQYQTTGVASAIPIHVGGSSRPISFAARSRSPSPAVDIRHSHRMSMPAHMSSILHPGSSTPEIRAASPPSGIRTPPTSFEEMGTTTPTTSPPRRVSRDTAKPSSREAVSVNGFGPSNAGEQHRNRGKARIGVVIGAMYLLVGRWPDATREISNSLVTARNNGDYVWQAKATDYLLVCLLMCAWAGMDFRIPDALRPASERPASSLTKALQSSSTYSQHEMSLTRSVDPEKRAATLQSLAELLPDVINAMQGLYGRAHTFTEDRVPSLSFSHSSIRHAKLLAALRVSQGILHQDLLRHIVTGNLLPQADSVFPGFDSLLSKHEIVSILLRAYPDPNDPSLSTSERVATLTSIAGLLSELRCHRKQALVIKDILSALLPGLVHARKEGAAEMGVHPAADLVTLNTAPGSSGAQGLLPGSIDAGLGMQAFLILVCQSFGIHHGHHGEQNEKAAGDIRTRKSVRRAMAAALEVAISNCLGDQEMKLDIVRSCINICEALPDLAGALRYSAVLLRIAGSGVAPGPESSNGSPDLAVDEQVRLASNISRTLSAAQYLGLKHPEAEYWDEFLIRHIKFVAGNPARCLIPHAKSELEIAQQIEAKKENNPFIYNPFLQTHSKTPEPVLVAGEEATFEVMLQNLYDFDVVIDHVTLIADGMSLICPPQSVILGPYRTQTMLITAIPQREGPLVIVGCSVKMRGCCEREFACFSDAWALRLDAKGKNLHSSNVQRILDQGTDDTDAGKRAIGTNTPGPQATFLAVKVIDNQPLVVLGTLSLPQAAVMLFEGETKTFKFALRNTSSIAPADLVLLSFTDSTATQVREALASKELSAAQLYEMEISTARNPALRCKDNAVSNNLAISPLGEIMIEIEIFGKPGLKHATLQVDYGFVGVPRSEVEGQFYTRQISVPITITVKPNIVLTRNDIWPITDAGMTCADLQHDDETDRGAMMVDNVRENTSLQIGNRLGISNCLLLFVFHNYSTSALNLQLQAQSTSSASEEPSAVSKYVIQSGTSARIAIPIPRIYLPASSAHAAIPSLDSANKRQFVVSATAASPHAERQAREAFWYREELLKMLSATWHEESTRRSGTIDLRRLSMTREMVSAYKLDDVEIEMCVKTGRVHGGDEGPTIQASKSSPRRFEVPTSTFLTLTTTLRNRSSSRIRLFLRVQPSLAKQSQDIALDLSKRLLVNGVLQQALAPLEAKGELTVEIAFMILSSGVYEWNATVEEVGDKEPGRRRGKTGELDLWLSEEKRVWCSERPCVVIAKDEL